MDLDHGGKDLGYMSGNCSCSEDSLAMHSFFRVGGFLSSFIRCRR